jgi:hypothetical protein
MPEVGAYIIGDHLTLKRTEERLDLAGRIHISSKIWCSRSAHATPTHSSTNLDRTKRSSKQRMRTTLTIMREWKTVLPPPRTEGTSNPSDLSIKSGRIDAAIQTGTARWSSVRCQKSRPRRAPAKI